MRQGESLMSNPSPPPLFTVRSAVVLLLGLLCGAVVTALSVLSHTPLAAASLAGVVAAGGGIAFFHKMIG
jgi:hypothetical protein